MREMIKPIVDPNVPTVSREKSLQGIKDEISKIQVKTLNDNCIHYGSNALTDDEGVIV